MKTLILLFHFLPIISSAQLSGEIVTDMRKIVSPIDYTITGNQSGKFTFDIVVNRDGQVTSCVLIKSESTLVSTPLMMKSKNLILTGLKFESGYQFPEFHRGHVSIIIVNE